MKRREFMLLLGGMALSWPIAARAQPGRVARVGVLMGIGESDPEAKPRVEALQSGLKKSRLDRGPAISTLIIVGPPAISTEHNYLQRKSSS